MSERVLAESGDDDLDMLEDRLKALGKRADKLTDQHPDDFGSTLDGEQFEELFMDFAKDLDDGDAEEKCKELIDDLADVLNALKADKSPSFKPAEALFKEYKEIFKDIQNGLYEEDDDDLDDEAEGDDGHVYSQPDAVRFVQDMQDEGFEVTHYKGRFYWQGPSVRTSRKDGIDLDDIIKATRVKLQWDNMGLDLVVYPVKKDPGMPGKKHESTQIAKTHEPNVNTFALGSSPAASSMRGLIEDSENLFKGEDGNE